MKHVVWAVLATLAVVGALIPARGQESRGGLQTRVADLETRVAKLEMARPSPVVATTADAAAPDSGNMSTASAGRRLLVGRVPGGLPPGEPGIVSPVLVGPYVAERPYLPFVVRNNTQAQVANLSATVAVRDSSGELIASGATLMNVKPAVLKPGEYGIGYAVVEGGELPGDASFEIALEAGSSAEPDAVDLEFAEIGARNGRVVGMVENASDAESLFPSVLVLCFSEDGSLVSSNNIPIENDTLSPGESAPFQHDPRGEPCAAFLAAAS